MTAKYKACHFLDSEIKRSLRWQLRDTLPPQQLRPKKTPCENQILYLMPIFKLKFLLYQSSMIKLLSFTRNYLSAVIMQNYSEKFLLLRFHLLCYCRFLDILHEAPLFAHRKPARVVGSVFYCLLLASSNFPFPQLLGHCLCCQAITISTPLQLNDVTGISILGRLCYFGHRSSMDIPSHRRAYLPIALQL